MSFAYTSNNRSISDIDITQRKIHSFLLSQGIVEEPVNFIGKVSNAYHSIESKTYDKDEIALQSSIAYWNKAISEIMPQLGDKIRVLDYGAGTGFATLLVLNSGLINKISEFVCYDLSPEMLEICKENVKKFTGISFKFLSWEEGKSELMEQEPFDLVLTNSLIHHIYDLKSFFGMIRDLIKPGGYYIAGHEPNHSFYQNNFLIRKTKVYQRYKRVKQKFHINYWMQKLKFSKNSADLATLTNDKLMRSNVIGQPIPPKYLYKMIDIHVPFGLTLNQPWGQPGFSPKVLKNELLGKEFEIVAAYTYSHIKDGSAAKDPIWSRIDKKLKKQFPEDGADCLMVFKKGSE